MIGIWTRDWALEKKIAVDYRPETTSTNDLAKESPAPYSGIHLYMTDHQTHGRGRAERTWSDSAGALLSSWCFHLEDPPQPIASPLIGLALYRAAKTSWPALPWNLKAPNDLYLGEKKTAGLLLETVSVGPKHRFVIGLGLNVQTNPALDIATSLETHLGEKIDRGSWARFLECWWRETARSLSLVTQPVLQTSERGEILDALNRHPLLKMPYKDVLPDGSLQTAHGITHWHTL